MNGKKNKENWKRQKILKKRRKKVRIINFCSEIIKDSGDDLRSCMS